MKSKIESLVDVINEFCGKETDERLEYNNLTEIAETDKDFPDISFVGDEGNDSGDIVMTKTFWDDKGLVNYMYLPSLSYLEFESEIGEIFGTFLKDYDEVSEKESKGEEINGWQLYYKEMFERIFSKKEIELLRSKYGKK